MTSEATMDLHGHAYSPFWGWDEETIYMERETNDQRREAQHRMWEQAGKDADLRKSEVRPEPIHMRWTQGEEVMTRSNNETDEGWLECPEDHPDAVRFWKA